MPVPLVFLGGGSNHFPLSSSEEAEVREITGANTYYFILLFGVLSVNDAQVCSSSKVTHLDLNGLDFGGILISQMPTDPSLSQALNIGHNC